MPPSPSDAQPDNRLAVTAQVLYLANLLLLPGIAFLVLLALYFKFRDSPNSLTAFHLRQTLSASLWAGILLLACNGLILGLGGYDGPWTWMIVILYFTVAHSTLIILGMIGLIKAMAGQAWRYPLIGALVR
jgi:uncharacterized Tic20 family protein